MNGSKKELIFVTVMTLCAHLRFQLIISMVNNIKMTVAAFLGIKITGHIYLAVPLNPGRNCSKHSLYNPWIRDKALKNLKKRTYEVLIPKETKTYSEPLKDTDINIVDSLEDNLDSLDKEE